MIKNHKESYELLDQQYKLSQEELAQKDGTGKLYGRPRRLATIAISAPEKKPLARIRARTMRISQIIGRVRSARRGG